MNNTIFYYFYNFAHQSQIFDKIVVFTAVYFPFIVVILAGTFLLFCKKWKEIILVFFSGGLAVFVALVLKFLFHNPRPFLALTDVYSLFPETGFSFPSGHATFFSALAVSLFFIHKKAGYIFMFFAFIIGLARVIAGVHFPIDILGGFIFGTLVSLLFNFILKILTYLFTNLIIKIWN